MYMNIEEGFIICSYEDRMSILKATKEIKNYTFLTLKDLEDRVLGTAKKKAVFLLMKKYELSYEVACEYISYMPYVEDKSYSDLKLDSILTAKRHLIECGMYKNDPLFLNRLKGKKITFYNVDLNSKLRYIQSALPKDCMVYEEAQSIDIKPLIVHEFKNTYDEVLFVCNQIIDLIKRGVPLKNIHLCNLNQEYTFLFERMMYSYNIAIDIPTKRNILSQPIAHEFLDLCKEKSSFHEVFESLKQDSIFYSSLFNLIVSYDLVEDKPSDYIDFLKIKLMEMSFPKDIYEEMISTTEKASYSKDDYVFYLGLNLGISPKVYKDDLYLNDEELVLIHHLPSTVRNQEAKEKLKRLLLQTDHIFISYKKHDSKEECFPSNVLSELNHEVKHVDASYGYSKLEDDIRLGIAYTKLLKYKEQSSELNLYSIDHLKYNSFDNRYKGITKETLNERFERKPLKMAYSNLKTYFACPFSYYADRILGLNEFKPSMAARLGTFAHAVLEDSYADDFKIEESFSKNTNEIAEDVKDKFYFSMMEDVLKSLVDYNKKHEDASMLKNIEREIHIVYNEGDVMFEGYIDKLMYTEIQGEIYAAIVDYKTGKDIISLDNVEDGFHLQLPSYMFLLSKYEGFAGKKLHILGIYLQKVNIIALDNTLDITQQREKSFRLQGYSIKQHELISMLDPEYSKSDYIYGMSTLKDGGFSRYARLVTSNEEDELIGIVDELIHSANDKIRNAEFPIEPKRIEGINQSCTFCKYADICYKKFEDFKDLEKKPYPKKECDA